MKKKNRYEVYFRSLRELANFSSSTNDLLIQTIRNRDGSYVSSFEGTITVNPDYFSPIKSMPLTLEEICSNIKREIGLNEA